jgi:hypothetical protein
VDARRLAVARLVIPALPAESDWIGLDWIGLELRLRSCFVETKKFWVTSLLQREGDKNVGSMASPFNLCKSLVFSTRRRVLNIS